MEEKFTWISFYKELSKKLLNYKNNRRELADFVYTLDNTEYLKMEDGSRIKDIDPFSFYGIFNRGISEDKRKRNLKKIKDFFQITSEIPLDFCGIPVIDNRRSFYFEWFSDASLKVSCDTIWNIFEKVVFKTVSQEDFETLVNRKGIGLASATIPMFWINPDEYMPLDKNSLDYLLKTGLVDKSKFDKNNYLSILDEIKNKIRLQEISENSFVEISFNAWANNDEEDNLKNGDIVMSNKIENYKKLLLNTHNLILHGAPGTGKTHLAKEIAKSMGAEYEMVQFHPSYDYTDFVEGLRPVNSDNSPIGFERKDGAFKKFCEKALLSNSTDSDILKDLNDNPTVWKVSLEGTGDNPTRTDCMENGYIRLGWDDYGDVADFSNFDGYTEHGGSVVLVAFQSKMKIGDIVLSCWSSTEIDAIGIVTGDYEYRSEGGAYPRYRTVKWLVKGIRENIVEKNRGKTLTLASVYRLSVSIQDVVEIANKYSKENSVSKKDFIFIIDEINRGEISKIFGELFFAIDPSYRGKDGLIKTQYQNLIKENNIFYEGFYVPENVYIIGTMNDIDRSVESMDFAFRRRFTFKEITAKETQEEILQSANLSDECMTEAIKRMDALNNAISKIDGLSSAYHIGGAYFLKLKELDDDFDKLWEYHIEGLLREYLRGMEDAETKLEDLHTAYKNEQEA